MDSAESSYEEKYLEAQRTEQNVKSMEAKVKELIKLTDISSQDRFQNPVRHLSGDTTLECIIWSLVDTNERVTFGF